MQEQEFYIGQIFDGFYPPDIEQWCKENNAYPHDLGNYRYELRENPPAPEPTVDQKKARVRAVRDQYLNDIEWRVSRYRDQKELGITTTDDENAYLQILQYMQYLRDYPESSETWYEQNPLTFDEWLAK